MSTALIRALSKLVQAAGAGGYTLPADVEDAHAVWLRLQRTELPRPREFGAEDAADRIVQAAAAGETFDPLKLCRDYHAVTDERRLYDEALAVVRMAVEQAANIAVAAASDATERIITEHLRPAHDDVLAKAAEVAGQLRPYTDGEYRLDLQGIVAATSSKIRAAYLALPGLLDRQRIILDARRHANVVGQRKAEHDTAGLFAMFADPMSFHPGWKPPARIPQFPMPEDETARLLWLVSDAATAARPWLPTVAEQDAAWWARFGEQVEAQARARRDGQAIAGRITHAGSDSVPLTRTATALDRRAELGQRLLGVPVNGGADQ
jgi:hypothetical protein